MKIFRIAVFFQILLFIFFAIPLKAEIVQTPFFGSSLTDAQLDAWNYYISEESARHGCSYGDDPRLVENPRGVLTDLAEGKPIEPLQVTLRTFLFSGESIQALLKRNMYIASMECNPVYHFEGDFIGHPVLPFEEYIDILFRKLDETPRISEHIDFIRSTKVASIDARWFWTFFVLDQDHHRLLGRDYDLVRALAMALPGPERQITPENSYWHIYDVVFKADMNDNMYVPNTNQCRGESAEPGQDIIVDKNIKWSSIAALYNAEGIRYSGAWRPSVRRESEGFTLAEGKLIDTPVNPYFNIERNVRIFPKECR
ncbi:hypothetical protein SAMN05421693_12511 [Ectothiorhodospira magna]|uniref:Uncharacterized protein n=1 Tax=Ectothiorhodospira magna TaxID=867345 RepID=A0A1H9FA56_9GAMM|nr:hypothetical protein [Ectothiorhodospira magna]SEQ34188.1 hypothetical protein SAMN05421693_12511 [Ectothiorhodospira magna]